MGMLIPRVSRQRRYPERGSFTDLSSWLSAAKQMFREARASVAYKLSLRDGFWRIRAWTQRARFMALKRRLTAHSFLSERLETARLFVELFWVVAAQAAYAAGVAAVAALVDRYLWVLEWEYGIPLRAMNGGSFLDLCVAVAGITGVLLGLYFTAIGVVVGSVYSRVPSDIRALSIREKIGDRYLRFVALTCIYALFIGTVYVIGFGVSRSGLTILLIFTCYSVFAFLQLGLRVYRFFDPEVLADRINHETSRAMHYVAARSPYAYDRSFQTHYRERVEEGLATYRSLFALVNSAPPNLDASYTLLDGHSDLWFIYTNLKSEIPAASEWYRFRSEFGSVLASSDDSLLDARLGVAVMPEPASVRDYLWFDDTIASTIAENLAIHFDHGDLERPMRYLMSFQSRILAVAQLLAIEEALLVESRVSATVINAFVTGKVGGLPHRIDAMIQVGDFLALAPMQVLLGTAARVREIEAISLSQRTDWIGWYMRHEYYHERLPRAILEKLMALSDQLRFELQVEGQFITTNTYLREQYVVALMIHLTDSMQRVLKRFESGYVDNAIELAGKSDRRVAMHLALRGIETCHKLDVHGTAIAGWFKTMIAHHVREEQFASPFDAATFTVRVDALRTRLLELIASLTFKVYDSDARPVRDLPDYFGFAYRLIAQELFSRMARGDTANFDLLFRTTFGLSLLAHQRLVTELRELPAQIKFNYVAEPVTHLLELSGYALLFSSLHGEGTFWRIARSVWKESADLLKPELLLAVYAIDADIALRPWFNNRFNWSREFRDLVGETIREGRHLAPIIGAIVDYVNKHPIPIPVDARYIFLLAYLRWQPGFESAEVHRRFEGFASALDHAFEDQPEWSFDLPSMPGASDDGSSDA